MLKLQVALFFLTSHAQASNADPRRCKIKTQPKLSLRGAQGQKLAGFRALAPRLPASLTGFPNVQPVPPSKLQPTLPQSASKTMYQQRHRDHGDTDKSEQRVAPSQSEVVVHAWPCQRQQHADKT